MIKHNRFILKSTLSAACVLLLSLALFGFIYKNDNKYNMGSPYGESGVLLFDDADLEKPLPLVDGWELYPDRLYTPKDFEGGALQGRTDKFTFIGEYSNFSFFEKNHSPFGSATYRLTLKYGGEQPVLFLSLPEIFTDYKLWANGKPILIENRPQTVAFPTAADAAAGGGRIELILSVANNTHYYSGLTYPPMLGTSAVISRMNLIKDIFYGLLCLFPLSLSLFAASSLMTKGYDKRFIHFGLFCLFSAFQASYHFLLGMGVPPILCYALEDTARMAALYETIALCTLECDLHLKKWYKRAVQPICIGFSVLTAITVIFIIPNAGAVINPYGRIVDIYRIICFLYLFGCAVYGLAHEHRGSPLVLAACAVTGASFLLNIIQNNKFEPIYTGWQSEYAGLLLVLLFFALIIRHINELVEMNKSLTGNLNMLVHTRTRELNAVLEERKAFFSNLAHDMKAPIASIHGFVNLIERGNHYVDEDLRGYLSLIGSQTDELGRRVQALTDLHNFDKITEPPGKICLNELLEQVYHDNEPETCAVGILLTVPQESSLSEIFVFGVRKKLLILFENLIYNAMSFTKEDGEISITVNTEGCFVAITVTDTGCGIEPEHLPHIFERFYSSRESTGDGSGLGLYIAKITVEEMGGSITAASEVGKGTSFIIKLPIER